MPRAKVVSFINYKGGVGKTTSSYHVACSLVGHHKKRVLLIDIDPQTNLTFLCAPVDDWRKFKSAKGTIATLYKRWTAKKALETRQHRWISPIKVVGNNRIEGLDLIPCDVELIGEDIGGGYVAGTFPSMELLRQNSALFLRERGFLNALIREIQNDYDFIIIDCPPNLYLMTQNALAASDWYVITAIPDHLSTIGLNILQEKVTKIGKLIESARVIAGEKSTRSAVAQLGGIIFVKVRLGGSRLTIAHQSKMNEIRSSTPVGTCFATHTTELIGYSEAAEASVPVWAHASDNARNASSKGEYQAITKEFLAKFG